METSLVNPA